MLNSQHCSRRANPLAARLYRGVLALLLVFLSACGGGSSGTGLDQDEGRVRGRFIDDTGVGISGVEITLLETGEVQITADDGRFLFSAPIESLASVTFEILGQQVASFQESAADSTGMSLSCITLVLTSNGQIALQSSAQNVPISCND
jgi:hypothetical protein